MSLEYIFYVLCRAKLETEPSWHSEGILIKISAVQLGHIHQTCHVSIWRVWLCFPGDMQSLPWNPAQTNCKCGPRYGGIGPIFLNHSHLFLINDSVWNRVGHARNFRENPIVRRNSRHINISSNGILMSTVLQNDHLENSWSVVRICGRRILAKKLSLI